MYSRRSPSDAIGEPLALVLPCNIGTLGASFRVLIYAETVFYFRAFRSNTIFLG